MNGLDNDPMVARRYAAFERHSTAAGVILGLSLLATTVVPVSVDPNVFLWDLWGLPDIPWTVVAIVGHWLVGLGAVVAAVTLRGAARGGAYILLGAVVLAGSGAAGLVLPTFGQETTAGVDAALVIGLIGACVLLWVEHIRLHLRPGKALRICEAVSGAAVLVGFGALTGRLAALLVDAPEEIVLSVGGRPIGANPRALLLCGIVVLSFLALGGLAAVIDSVIPYRGRRQSIGVLTPIYFAMIVLAAMMMLLGGRILGAEGVVRGFHITVLVLTKPLLIAYGLAAVAAARAKSQLTTN